MKHGKKLLIAWFLIAAIPSLSLAGDIKLMFPKLKKENTASAQMVYSLAKDGDKQEYSETDLQKFVEQIETKEYRIEQIELWIEGKAESVGVTKFFISFEGKGGCKIILRPESR